MPFRFVRGEIHPVAQNKNKLQHRRTRTNPGLQPKEGKRRRKEGKRRREKARRKTEGKKGNCVRDEKNSFALLV
jgi:hypothetical protein